MRIMVAGRFEDIAVAAHLKEIDINTKGVVNGLHAAFPYLRSTPKSVVVNLSSASAIYGQAELAVYSATKFFVRGITEALDAEWSRYGIWVIAMWPLYVQTAMTDHISTGTTGNSASDERSQDVVCDRRGGRTVVAAAHHQVHFPVGSQTKVSAVASRFSPAWLQRLVNKRLARL
jgi:short-subunit dehydrogenase